MVNFLSIVFISTAIVSLIVSVVAFLFYRIQQEFKFIRYFALVTLYNFIFQGARGIFLFTTDETLANLCNRLSMVGLAFFIPGVLHFVCEFIHRKMDRLVLTAYGIAIVFSGVAWLKMPNLGEKQLFSYAEKLSGMNLAFGYHVFDIVVFTTLVFCTFLLVDHYRREDEGRRLVLPIIYGGVFWVLTGAFDELVIVGVVDFPLVFWFGALVMMMSVVYSLSLRFGWAMNELADKQEELSTLNRELTDMVEEKAKDLLLFRDSFHFTGDAILITDLQGRIIYTNPAFQNLYGYSTEDLIGQNPRIVKSGKNPSSIYGEMWKSVMEGIVWTGELINKKRDQTEIYVEMKVAPIIDSLGRTINLLGTQRDITPRKLLEQQLRERNVALEEAKAHTEHILDSMREIVIITDKGRKILSINSYGAEVAGYQSWELEGKTFEFLVGSAEFVESAYHVALHREVKDFEIPLVHRNKDSIPVSWNSIPLKDRQSKTIGVLSVGRDLREMKQLQQALLRSEKLAAIGRLAAKIAHEINNPLGIIETGLYLVQKKVDDPEYVRDELKEIKEEIDRIGRIVKGLLEFARFSKHELSSEDLNLLIEDVLHSVESHLHSKNVRIDWKLEPGLPEIYVAADQMKQVLLNFLRNAEDAVSAGGCITVETKRRGDWCRIEITDDGSGIPDDILPQIFDPFFTTKDFGQGTGLGLSISYSIIREMGGDIKVKSKVDVGTTFTIVLPLSEQS